MRTVLVLSPDEVLRARLLREMDDRSIFSASSDEEALKTLRFTEIDLIFKTVVPPSAEFPAFVARVRNLGPATVVVAVLPTNSTGTDDEAAVEVADFVLFQPFTSRQVQGVLRQAEEKLLLLQEVSALRLSRRGGGGFPVQEYPVTNLEVSSHSLTQVVKEFAKALAAGFDLPRVLNLFLDAVSEMARPSRSAILLADQEGRQYQVRAFRGLAPNLVESVSLPADDGLPLWLAAEGRLIQIDELQERLVDSTAREIKRELSLLQAVLAIPLICRGELVAILTLGQRITGGAYSRRETEVLFNLATHLATAIRDIRVHHLLEYQKEFNERILAHMSNGVITISPDEKVVMMNRRAEEILGIPARDVLNRDLRMLPSPLGDLLFETLSRGRALNRSEVQLPLRNLPLEISTYPVVGDGTAPLGAVLVFEDLTAQRQLAQEKRSAEQLQLLTRIVARIADEIKNPLVSISTFMELLPERYEDTSFRHHFAAVVGRDVRRMVQIFEKLAALVNEGDYKLGPVDVRRVASECLEELGAQQAPAVGAEARLLTFIDESTQKHVTANLSHEGRSFVIRGDHGMLKKAISYLVWYLLRKTGSQEAKISLSISRLEPEDRVRLTVSSRSADVRPDELRSIFDPIQVVQENLIDVGPCVSQRIVEAQGGQLEARQERGEVSFVATLPTVPAGATA
jgi:nitrogen-specific signal transduction histidine kinase